MDSSWNFESFDDPWEEAVTNLLNKAASQEWATSSPIRVTSSRPSGSNTIVREAPAFIGHLTITTSTVDSANAMGSDSSSVPKSPLMPQEAPRDVPKEPATAVQAAEHAVGAPSHVDTRSAQPLVPAPAPVGVDAAMLEPHYILSDDFNAMRRMISKQTLPTNTFSAFWKCLKGKISLSWRILGYGRHLPDDILYDPQLIFTRQEGLKFDNLHKYVPEWDYFTGAKSLVVYLRYQARLLEHDAIDAALAPLEEEIDMTQQRLAAATTATTATSLDNGASMPDVAQDETGRRGGGGGKKRKSSSLGGDPAPRRRDGGNIDDSSSSASSAFSSSPLHPSKRRKQRSRSDTSDECEFDAAAAAASESSIDDDGADDDSDVEFSISSQSKAAKHSSSSVGPQFQVHYIPPCQPRPVLTADELSSLVSNRVWSPSCVDEQSPASARRKGKRKSKGNPPVPSSSFAVKQEEEIPASLTEEALAAQREARCSDYLASGMVRAMRSQLWTGCYQPSFLWQGKCITASSSKMAAPVHARGSVCLVDAADHPDAAQTLNVAHGKDLRLVCVLEYYLQPSSITNSHSNSDPLPPNAPSKTSPSVTDEGGEDGGENTQSTCDLQSLLAETVHASANANTKATTAQATIHHEAVWFYEVYDGQTTWYVHPRHVVRALPLFTLPGSVDSDRPVPIPLHFPANEEMLLHLLYHEGGDVVQASRHWKKLCKLARRPHTAAEADHDDGGGGEASQSATLPIPSGEAALSAKDEAVLKLFQHLSSLQLDATQFVPWSAVDFDVLRTCWDPRQSSTGGVLAAMSSSSDDSAQFRAMQNNLPSWIAKQINNGTPLEFASTTEWLDLDNYMPPLRDWYLRYKRASASSRKKATSSAAGTTASEAPPRCQPRTFQSFFMGVLCLWPSLVKQRGAAMAEMFRLPWATSSPAGPTEDGAGDGSRSTDAQGVNVLSDPSGAGATTAPAAERPMGTVVAAAATAAAITASVVVALPSAVPTVTAPGPLAEPPRQPQPLPPPVVEFIDLSAPDESDLDDVIFIEDD